MTLREVLRGTPGESLRRRAEANAQHLGSGVSGLGLLLLREYGVSLAWTIQRINVLYKFAIAMRKKGELQLELILSD